MQRISTRALLTIAGIAVGGGLIGIPNAYLFQALSTAAPLFLGLTAGFYLLPGLTAQAVFHRPGVALLTQVLAGLAASPFTPTGIASVTVFALLGVLVEIPYAVLGYRKWGPWVAYIAAAFVTAVYGVLWGVYYDTVALGPVTLIGQPVMLLVSMLLFTWIARAVTARLGRIGVLRGLRPRRESRVGA